MANKAQHNLYKNVIPQNTIEDAYSQVILCADFDQIQFSLLGALATGIGTVVGTFEVGEEVTGGTSAATGIIAAFTSTTMLLTNVVGTFQNAEAITGTDSGATAVLATPVKPSYEVSAYTSNNDKMNPPDPTQPVSPTNQYAQVMYSDYQGGVNYDTAHPFVEGAATPYYTQKTFKAFPQGAVWFFLFINWTSGAVAQCDIDLFSNFT